MDVTKITWNLKQFVHTITTLTRNHWYNLIYRPHPGLSGGLRVQTWMTGCRKIGIVDHDLINREMDLDTYQMLVSLFPRNNAIVFHDGDVHALFIVGVNIVSTLPFTRSNA